MADAGDFSKLALEGAEYVFGHSQPDSYASYLNETRRSVEAIAFCKVVFATANTKSRRP